MIDHDPIPLAVPVLQGVQMKPAQKPDEREPDYHAEMQLPPNMHCSDCKHAKRCFGFGYSLPGCTSCDFWPNRFVRADDEGAA